MNKTLQFLLLFKWSLLEPKMFIVHTVQQCPSKMDFFPRFIAHCVCSITSSQRFQTSSLGRIALNSSTCTAKSEIVCAAASDIRATE